MSTALVADPAVREHDPGIGHPECPQRFSSVMEAVGKAGLLEQLALLPVRSASDAELALAHSPDYIQLVDAEVTAGRYTLSTGDTDISGQSDLVARRAAGGVLSAVDSICYGVHNNAFCVVRPPGHHATASRGMGFCLYNSVAIAARYAQTKFGIERVAIADWDVHHGNGTQDIFYADPTVLSFSTHEWPLYPGTGARSETGLGAGSGFTMNRPFPAGSGRAEIFGAFRGDFLPALEDFRPELILLSAGFDSREHDLLGHFRLTDRDFADLTELIMEAADKHCGSRLVTVLEGGYNLSGLASAAVAHLTTLAGRKFDSEES